MAYIDPNIPDGEEMFSDRIFSNLPDERRDRFSRQIILRSDVKPLLRKLRKSRKIYSFELAYDNESPKSFMAKMYELYKVERDFGDWTYFVINETEEHYNNPNYADGHLFVFTSQDYATKFRLCWPA